MRLWVATAALALLAACGYVGPPLPPALNVPRAVTDLRAEEVGDRIVIHFTTPAQTTEDLPITQLRTMQLRVEADGAAQSYEVPAAKLGALEHEIPAKDWTGKQLTLTLRTIGATGRISDLSNSVTLAVIPPLEQPRLTPRNVPEGAALTWTGNAAMYRIQRSIPADAKPDFEQIAETDKREFTDETAADGVGYVYVVTGFSGTARSLPSEPVTFTPQDTFPPAVPAGLTAVALNGAVDLSWTRNTEDDFASYILLKAEGDEPLKIFAEGVVLPTFPDRAVARGKRYRYTLISVDRKGNRSKQSEEKSVLVE